MFNSEWMRKFDRSQFPTFVRVGRAIKSMIDTPSSTTGRRADGLFWLPAECPGGPLRSLKKQWITRAEFYEFVEDVPDHLVYRNYCVGRQDRTQLSAIISELNLAPPKIVVYDASCNFALTAVHESSGWVLMEYADAVPSLVNDVTIHEKDVFQNVQLSSLLMAIRQLNVDYQLGMEQSTLKSFLSQNWISYETTHKSICDDFPFTASLLVLIFGALRWSLSEWGAQADAIQVRTMSISGPGLTNNIMGMMNAVSMQAMVNYLNNEATAPSREVLRINLQIAFRKIEILLYCADQREA